jgi:site-specific recombinase XerD
MFSNHGYQAEQRLLEKFFSQTMLSEQQNAMKRVDISTFLQALKRQKVSASTLRGYDADLRGFFTYLRLDAASLDVAALEQIRPEDIESYLQVLAAKQLTFSTIKRALAAIRRFFTFLVDQGIRTNNPAQAFTVRPAAKSMLSTEQVVALFEYLIRKQHRGSESNIIRYRRDEVILLLMILYGVRQYQLSTLKLSQLHKMGKEVSLRIKQDSTIRLEGCVLQKLRDYLSIRQSNADTIFLEPLRNKPVDHVSLRAMLTELSYALGVECTLRSFYDTYVHLQQNPDERQKLLERIGSISLQRTYGAVSHA